MQAKDDLIRVRVRLSEFGSCAKSIYIRVLGGIKDELHPISERSNAVGYQGNEADEQTVCDLAVNVRDAIIGYQVSADLLIAPRMHR